MDANGTADKNGPATFEEAMLWAEKLFPDMLAALAEQGASPEYVLGKLNDMKVVVTTTYSGMGVPEIACSFLKKAFQKHKCCLEFGFHGCRDMDPLCRKMLTFSRFPSEHMFGDIMDSVSPELAERLKSMQKASRLLYDKQAVGKDKAAKNELTKSIGRAFAVQALKALEQCGMTKDCCCHCYHHMEACRLWPVASPGTLHMEVGGNTCTPWSSYGKHGGWLDPVSVPCVVWLHNLRVSSPGLIINECTPRFDVEIAERLLQDKYISSSVVFGPPDMGLPCNRGRRYTVFLRRDLCSRLVVPRLLLFDADKFQRLIAAKIIATAEMFLRASPEDVQQSLKDLAEQRGVHLLDGDPVCVKLLLSPWLRSQVQSYQQVLSKKGMWPTESEICVDLSQSATDRPRYGDVIPCLLRSSFLFALKARRPVLPVEYLCIQCIPVTLPPQNEFAECCPWTPEFIASLPRSQILGLAGNSMVVPAVGSILMAGLLCAASV